MSIRRKKQPETKKTPRFSPASLPFFRWFLRLGVALFLILLGGLLFNLDRIGGVSYSLLLQYRSLLPAKAAKLLPGGSAKYGTPSPAERLQGIVTEVHDGDTIILWNREKELKYRIRLYGIDAPELAQNGGSESRDTLRKLILGKPVLVETVNLDRYGRAVGKIVYEGRSVNLFMVLSGQAWHYAAYAKREYDLAVAQEEAKSRKNGLWREPHPQPPWEYRREHRR